MSTLIPLLNPSDPMQYKLIQSFTEINRILNMINTRLNVLEMYTRPELLDAKLLSHWTTKSQANENQLRMMKQYIDGEFIDLKAQLSTVTIAVSNLSSSTTTKMMDIQAIDVHQEITDLYDRLREAGFDI